ncbi:MAG: hypothetical protein J6Q15_03365, partial [Clostridia bacterium]|nr:hypothetical protein [Clostridia bacterium]
ESGLIDRGFVPNADYLLDGDMLIKNIQDEEQCVSLERTSASLRLMVSNNYVLSNNNNVVRLKATSQYNSEISTDVYIYIVENFTTDSLLVSYNSDMQKDQNGNLPTDANERQPVDDYVVIYDSLVDDIVGDNKYNSISVYTYTNKSIYSYESNPGIRLLLYVNGERYDYTTISNSSLGIEISPVYKGDELVGLKFSVNPNIKSEINIYNIRIELDFTAFDFSQSDKRPVDTLNREFTIKVEKLVSEIYINGKGYKDNLDAIKIGVNTNINAYNSSELAKLYTYYDGQVGMPLNVQSAPDDAINSSVFVSFYEGYSIVGGNIEFKDNLSDKLSLYESQGFPMELVNGEYEINFANKNKVVYAAFNGEADDIERIYMVCKSVCTPDTFGGQTDIEAKYITFVSEIQVVGAVKDILLYKNSNDAGADHTLIDKYLPNNKSNVAYINLQSNSTTIDLTEIVLGSKRGNIKFSADEKIWSDTITIDQLSTIGNAPILYKVYFRTNTQCVDGIVISAPNIKNKELEYEFVNVVTSPEAVKVNFDNTYIWQSGIEDKVNIDGIANNVDLKYLALQSGRTVQFEVLGDNRGSNIKLVNAKSLRVDSDEYSAVKKEGVSIYDNNNPLFNTSAIKVSNTGNYLFDVRANSIGVTAILLIKTEFYVINVNNVVEAQNKYFIYEVAVYTPARELSIVTDKNSITYINDYYPDSALVEVNISVNSTATRTLQFSSNEVNESINLNYGEQDVYSIYGMKVTMSDNFNTKDGGGNNYFKAEGLNKYTYVGATSSWIEDFVSNSSKRFTIKALRDLKPLQDNGETSIYFDITIYQFGEEQIYQIRKVVYLGEYEKSTGIVVDGVDTYNNIYLSLLGQNMAQTTIEASIANSNA